MPIPQTQNNPIIQIPNLNIYGLHTRYLDQENISIGAGQCRDRNDVMDIVVGSQPLNGPGVAAPIIVNTTVQGVNGVEKTPILPNHLYVILVIADSRYINPPAGLLTDAATEEVIMPYGYDSYRFISYVHTDGTGQLLGFIDAGTGNVRSKFFNRPILVLSGGNDTVPTNVTLTDYLPFENYAINKAWFWVELQVVTPPSFVNFYNYGSPLVTHRFYADTTNIQSEQLTLMPAKIDPDVFSSDPVVVYQVANASDSVDLRLTGYEFNV